MITIAPDMYGRTVQLQSGDTVDTYQVTDGDTGEVFTLTVPAGKALAAVYDTINAMAPLS